MMPDLSGISEIKSSWADEIDEGDATTLPAQTQRTVGNTKIVTLYRFNEDGKKVKVVRTYRVEKKLVSHAVAQRKLLKKFGASLNDQPGPNSSTTVIAEDIVMQFIANKEECEKDVEQTAFDKLKASNKGVVKCRICKEDHWTTQCPYKDTLAPLKESLTGVGVDKPDGTEADTSGPVAAQPTGVKYIPPSRREGAVFREGISSDKRGGMGGRNDDTHAIRVSNLSENTQEQDLQELFKPFGSIYRIYLAKDKNTGQCKGFAFINYYRKEDAAKAISTLHGYGYDHLILNVEWAKPSTQ